THWHTYPRLCIGLKQQVHCLCALPLTMHLEIVKIDSHVSGVQECMFTNRLQFCSYSWRFGSSLSLSLCGGDERVRFCRFRFCLSLFLSLSALAFSFSTRIDFSLPVLWVVDVIVVVIIVVLVKKKDLSAYSAQILLLFFSRNAATVERLL